MGMIKHWLHRTAVCLIKHASLLSCLFFLLFHPLPFLHFCASRLWNRHPRPSSLHCAQGFPFHTGLQPLSPHASSPWPFSLPAAHSTPGCASVLSSRLLYLSSPTSSSLSAPFPEASLLSSSLPAFGVLFFFLISFVSFFCSYILLTFPVRSMQTRLANDKRAASDIHGLLCLRHIQPWRGEGQNPPGDWESVLDVGGCVRL